MSINARVLDSIQFFPRFVKNRRLTSVAESITVKAMQDMDRPEIRQMEHFGAARREQEPRCPVCGAECEWIYRYRGLDAAGCERCLERTDAWKEDACGENR